VIITFLHQYYKVNSAHLFPFSGLFDLNTERSVAAWLSGSILFISGIILLNNQAVNGTGERSVNLGFLILGLIVISLSADEIGSIHERLDEIADKHDLYDLLPRYLGASQLSGNSIKILIGGMASVVFVTSLFLISRDPSIKWVLILPVLAFLLFGLVVLQERYEKYLDASGITLSPATRSFRVVLEEGAELIGINILLIFALIAKSLRIGLFEKEKNHMSLEDILSLLYRRRRLFIICTLLTGLACIYFSTIFTDRGSRGILSEWFSSMVFLLIGIIIFFKNSADVRRPNLYLQVFPAIILSIFSVVFSYFSFGSLKCIVGLPLYTGFFIFLVFRDKLRFSMLRLALFAPIPILAVFCVMSEQKVFAYGLETLAAMFALFLVTEGLDAKSKRSPCASPTMS
jgi:hypothetical protein